MRNLQSVFHLPTPPQHEQSPHHQIRNDEQNPGAVFDHPSPQSRQRSLGICAHRQSVEIVSYVVRQFLYRSISMLRIFRRRFAANCRQSLGHSAGIDQQELEHRAQRVHVRARSHRFDVPSRLLRRHVTGSAQDHAMSGACLGGVRVGRWLLLDPNLRNFIRPCRYFGIPIAWPGPNP